MTDSPAPSLARRIRTALKRLAYSSRGRDGWQQPDRVLAVIGARPGAIVADLGSGGGYFTFRFARTVGNEGTVFAVDTDDDLLHAIERDAATGGFANVRTVHARPDGLELPAKADTVFLSNVFHHLPDPAGYFAAARSQLAPGGTVAILESMRLGLMARLFGHATDPAVIQAAMAKAGYDLVAGHGFLRRQSLQVFAPRDAERPID